MLFILYCAFHILCNYKVNFSLKIGFNWLNSEKFDNVINGSNPPTVINLTICTPPRPPGPPSIGNYMWTVPHYMLLGNYWSIGNVLWVETEDSIISNFPILAFLNIADNTLLFGLWKELMCVQNGLQVR